MSLFSNERVVTATSVSSAVLNEYANAMPSVIVGAVLEDKDIASTISKYTQNNLYSRAMSYYRYGASTYTRGLPKGTKINSNINTVEVGKVIEAEVSSSIVIRGIVSTTTSLLLRVYQYLQDIRLRDPLTNTIGNPYTDTPSNAVYSRYWYTPKQGDDAAVLIIEYSTANDVFHEVVSHLINDKVYYQVEYMTTNSALVPSGIPKYWEYAIGGIYTALNTIPKSTVDTYGDYFPILPFYEDKENLADTSHKGKPLYQTSRTLMRRLGMDYVSVADQLSGGLAESVGDAKGIYAYMLFGAEVTAGMSTDPGITTDAQIALWKTAQPTLEYLVNYFKQLALDSQSTKDAFQIVRANADQPAKIPPSVEAIEITDKSYQATYTYYYVDVSYVTGIQEHPELITSKYIPDSFTYVNSAWNSNTLEEQITNTLINSSLMVYSKQISANQFMVVEVCGFTQNLKMYSDTAAVTLPSNAFATENPSSIYVPLNRQIVGLSSKSNRNALMHASLSFLFYSYLVTKVKWYQDPGWGFIIQVVGVILAIPSGGTSLTWSSLFTVASATLIARTLLTYYLNMLIFKEFIKLIIKELGVEAAYALAFLASIYGMAGSSKGFMLPYAQVVLHSSIQMFNAAGAAIDKMSADLARDYAKLESEQEKYEDDLSRAQGLLTEDLAQDPWIFGSSIPDINFSQTAGEYIAQHTVLNPGILVLQAPSIYAELMLRLPSVDDTLRMNSEV